MKRWLKWEIDGWSTFLNTQLFFLLFGAIVPWISAAFILNWFGAK